MGVSSMFKKYTPEETATRNAAILAGWNGGKTMNMVRSEVGVTWRTVRDVLGAFRAQGVFVREMDPKCAVDWSAGDNLATLDRMYKDGSTYSQIAAHFGVTIGVISWAVTRFKITRPDEINIRNIQWARCSPQKGRERSEKRAQTKAKRDADREKRAASKQRREEEVARKAELKRLRDAPKGVEGQPIPPTKSRYVATPEELAAAKTLADLGRRDCRFPLNEPAEGEGETTLFCAKPARGSYCQWHAHVCTSAEQPSARDLIRTVRKVAA